MDRFGQFLYRVRATMQINLYQLLGRFDDDRPASSKIQATQSLQQGMKRLQARDFDAAEVAFSKVIQIDPQNAKAHVLLDVTAMVQLDQLLQAIIKAPQAEVN